MTDVKKQTIRLIHSGDSNMRIAALLNEEFGIPGHENEFYGPIEECRKEVATFRREAPGLALEAFKRGYSLAASCRRSRSPGTFALHRTDLHLRTCSRHSIPEARGCCYQCRRPVRQGFDRTGNCRSAKSWQLVLENSGLIPLCKRPLICYVNALKTTA